jgi:hypothetical protein
MLLLCSVMCLLCVKSFLVSYNELGRRSGLPVGKPYSLCRQSPTAKNASQEWREAKVGVIGLDGWPGLQLRSIVESGLKIDFTGFVAQLLLALTKRRLTQRILTLHSSLGLQGTRCSGVEHYRFLPPSARFPYQHLFVYRLITLPPQCFFILSLLRVRCCILAISD